MHLCAWTQSVADYLTIHCILSLSPSAVTCSGDIIPKKNSHMKSWSPDILNPEITADLSHVEDMCCLRMLTNTRWFCYTHKVIIRFVIIAMLTVYKVLICLLQCSPYFSKKISQNAWRLLNLPTWGVMANTSLPSLSGHVTQMFLWLEITQELTHLKALGRKKKYCTAKWF